MTYKEVVLHLRSATLADLDLLRHWDEQPQVIASDPNDDWGWEVELDRTPDWREQLIAEVDGRPIGFVQIIDPAREESHYWGMSQRICALLISGSGKRAIWAKAMARK